MSTLIYLMHFEFQSGEKYVTMIFITENVDNNEKLSLHRIFSVIIKRSNARNRVVKNNV